MFAHLCPVHLEYGGLLCLLVLAGCGAPHTPASNTALSKRTAETDKTAQTPVRPPDESLMRTALASALRITGANGRDQGSGVAIASVKPGEQYALTAYHVVADGLPRKIESFNLATYPAPAGSAAMVELVAFSEELDLAVLKLVAGDPSMSGLLLASETDIPPRVYSVGCSDGQPPTTLPERLVGQFKVRRREEKTGRLMWKTEIPPDPGRSGGALIDADGRLLGIAIAASGQDGYYCHWQEITQFLAKKRTERVARRAFGALGLLARGRKMTQKSAAKVIDRWYDTAIC